MKPTPPCRIDGVLAREANLAVIFRRGPSHYTQMLVWDLNSDVVTPGQWVKGRVYTKRCDVSPDGRFVVIAATNYSKSHRERFGQGPSDYSPCGYTSVSRPPYFSALTVWLGVGNRYGGGVWASNDLLHLDNFGDWTIDAGTIPRGVRTENLNLAGAEVTPVEGLISQAHGWKVIQQAQIEWLKREDRVHWGPQWKCTQVGILRKSMENGYLERESSLYREVWRACGHSGTIHREWRPEEWHPQWVDVDAKGRVVFGEDGCLWAWPLFPHGDLVMIADLNPNRFEAIPPPDWATEP